VRQERFLLEEVHASKYAGVRLGATSNKVTTDIGGVRRPTTPKLITGSTESSVIYGGGGGQRVINVLGKALVDLRSTQWPSAILSGVDGNKSFLHGNELTNLGKYAGYLKLVPRVQADVEQARYFACNEFDDLFVLLCLRYLGPRAQEAFNLWRCKEYYADDDEVATPWSDDEVIAILPGTFNFLGRTVEAGAGQVVVLTPQGDAFKPPNPPLLSSSRSPPADVILALLQSNTKQSVDEMKRKLGW
jgi:hypothetical protein